MTVTPEAAPEVAPARVWPNVRRPGISAAVRRALWVPGVALGGILVGAALWLRTPHGASVLWLGVLVGTGSVVVVRTVRGALRGHWAADVIAALAIITAAVMQQPLAGLIVVIMQTGGEALERFAEGRASDAVRQLEADRPQRAHVLHDEHVIDVRADDVAVGDLVVVRPGELVPCDGTVVSGTSELDTSRLTGEPIPESVGPGDTIQSGSLNGHRVFTIRATAIARESQYARIVDLVRTAQATKAPFQRMADRYAIWFTPLTLLVAVIAVLVSGDMNRFLAVLVVATPCPLILAPPIAIIGGINQAARLQIIVRTGAAIERLARVDTMVFDKTGTLTIGQPSVQTVTVQPPFTRADVLHLAGSVEQGASHLLARALIDAVLREGIALSPITDAVESPGRGVAGHVGAHHVAVGARDFVVQHVREHVREHATPGAETPAEAVMTLARGRKGLTAYIAVDGKFAGSVTYADRVRANAASVITTLRELGVRHAVLLSGDHGPNVQSVAGAVGIDDARGDLTPEDKVVAVRALAAAGRDLMMIGDGTNDAPALTAAGVGVALAGHGGGVTAEAADLVILIDDLARVPMAVAIARRTMRIARQSVWAGLTLSGVAMVVAATGNIPPTVGALLQEVIDVAVILNALRASAGLSTLFRPG